jgi:membrane carboxypeptidase/penicillin-binding protein PbpC
VHREAWIDDVTGRRACERGPGTRRAIYELWPSDLGALFAAAGLPRSAPPAALRGCEGFDDDNTSGARPVITSPRAGVHYTMAADDDTARVALQAVSEGDAQQVHWFVDATYVGVARSGQPLVWSASVGRHHVRVVDDRGRAATTTVDVDRALLPQGERP